MESPLKLLTPILSYCHDMLIDIVFRRKYPERDFGVLKGHIVDAEDLDSMVKMVKAEFAASMEKELQAEGDWSYVDKLNPPKPYEVYIMHPSLQLGNISLAVCVPVMNKEELMWLDEENNIWPNNPAPFGKAIASLSGPSRVLEALLFDHSKMMRSAMERLDVVPAPEHLDEELFDLRYPRMANTLNYSQKQAVAHVQSHDFDSGFFVVQGPPGCGKTTTMVGMIEAIGSGMIVSAPSNAAVANIALKLMSTTSYLLRQVVVFGENCDKSVHFLNPKFRGEKFRVFIKKYIELDEKGDDESKESLKGIFLSWLHIGPDTPIAELYQLCPFVGEKINDRRRLSQIIGSADIVFSTLNSAGSKFLQKSVGDTRSTFLLDEAGQCPEAEFFICTNFPFVKRIVVMGDPMQLPSTVIDQYCKQCGYGESWMGNVRKLRPVHLLDTQYRMDPQILYFPNKSFYYNRIKCAPSVVHREPYIESPFIFIDSKGRGVEMREKYSWKNPYEAGGSNAVTIYCD